MDLRRLTSERGSLAPPVQIHRPPESSAVVRPLRETDLPRIAELHQKVIPKSSNVPPAILHEQLSRIMLQHPWRNDALPSLVYQDSSGNVTGCTGVMPRPMLFRNRLITAAVSHSYIVEPGSRSVLAALELAKRFMSGPQDLSLAEGGYASRKIWERAGGSVSLLYSLCWTHPLQPSRYVLSHLRKRGLPSALGWILQPFCRLLDTLAPMAGKSFRSYAPVVSGAELDPKTFCETLTAFTLMRTLRPHYESGSSQWLLERLAGGNSQGGFHKVIVCNDSKEVVGWYLYCIRPNKIGAVMQIGAKESCAETVLDHLFYHAKRHGAVAVSGQVDPELFQALSRKDCLFHRDGGSWMLVHSRHPEILQAIHRGDAFLSRLEGEWWISYLLG
jgi:hypothetical protein